MIKISHPEHLIPKRLFGGAVDDARATLDAIALDQWRALLDECLTVRNGAAAGLERWTAVVSIVMQTPRTEERLRRNPLGIYVNGLSWSRELDSTEGGRP